MKIIKESSKIRCSKCKSLLEYSEDDVYKLDYESLNEKFELCNQDGNVENIGTNEEFAAKCLGLSVLELREKDINPLCISEFSVIKCPKCGEVLAIREQTDNYPLGISVEEEAFGMLNRSIYNYNNYGNELS